MDPHSSDSSSGEPAAMRRRVDLEGNFAAARRLRSSVGHKSPTPEKTSARNPYCYDTLLSGTLGTGEYIRVDLKSQDSGYFNNVLPGNANYYSTGDALSSTEQASRRDNDRSPESLDSRKTPRAAGEGWQQDTVRVASESTESIDINVWDDSEEKDTSSAETLQNSGSDTDSTSEALEWSADCSFSLVALDLSLEKADESLKLEREREEEVFMIISRHLSKVSFLTSEFHGIEAPTGKFVREVVNKGLQRWRVCGIADTSASLEQRFEAIRAYALDVWTVSLKQAESANRKELVTQVLSETPTDITSSEDDSAKYEAVGRVHKILRKASDSVRKSQHAVVRQRKILDKLCVVAETVVAKAEISCRAILNCLKTVVNVLEPAVGMSWIVVQAERKLDRDGKESAKFGNAASAVRQWTSEALCDAEVAVRLHREARRALREAWVDLEIMRSYQPHGVTALSRIVSTGERLLAIAQQPCISLDEVRECESNARLMRGTLLPLLDDMRNHRTLIEDCGDMCSGSVPVMLHALFSVTQSSCNAIEAALKGLSLLADDYTKK